MGDQLPSFNGQNWSLSISADCNYSSVTNGERKALTLADPKPFRMLEFKTNTSSYTWWSADTQCTEATAHNPCADV